MVLIRGRRLTDEDGNPTGVEVEYRVGHQQRFLWLTEAEVAGLTLGQIKALAQTRANADTRIAATLDLFNNRTEAVDNLDNLPGWAGWTGQEAADWIEANVTDLTSAKTALKAMAKAIVYLRNITI